MSGKAEDDMIVIEDSDDECLQELEALCGPNDAMPLSISDVPPNSATIDMMPKLVPVVEGVAGEEPEQADNTLDTLDQAAGGGVDMMKVEENTIESEQGEEIASTNALSMSLPNGNAYISSEQAATAEINPSLNPDAHQGTHMASVPDTPDVSNHSEPLSGLEMNNNHTHKRKSGAIVPSPSMVPSAPTHDAHVGHASKQATKKLKMTKESNREESIATLQARVQSQPYDFDAWVNLIKHMEEINNYPALVSVLERFLTLYPLCFGYWQKWANYETTSKKYEEALVVLQRAAKATPRSYQIWVSLADVMQKLKKSTTETRNVFREASQALEKEYRIRRFWESYYNFESEACDPICMFEAYKWFLSYPRDCFNDVLTNYVEWADHQSPSILTSKDLTEIDGDTDAAKASNIIRSQVAYLTSSQYIQRSNKMKTYEGLIERPYWHILPLDPNELRNWNNYLDFLEEEIDQKMQKRDEHEKKGEEDGVKTSEKIVEKLVHNCREIYGRCLVPCANYVEMWERYILFLRKHAPKEVSYIRSVFEECCSIYCKYDPLSYVLYGKYLEEEGDMDTAREIFLKGSVISEEVVPEFVCAYADFERRCGNLDHARNIYQEALNRLMDVHMGTEEKKEEGKDDGNASGVDLRILPANTKLFAYLSVVYAHFLHLVIGDLEETREVFKRAIDCEKKDLNLWISYIQFELMNPGPAVVDQMVEPIFTKALGTKESGFFWLPLRSRVYLWEYRLDIYSTRGTQMAQLVEIKSNLKYFKQQIKQNATPNNNTSTVLPVVTTSNVAPVPTTTSASGSGVSGVSGGEMPPRVVYPPTSVPVSYPTMYAASTPSYFPQYAYNTTHG